MPRILIPRYGASRFVDEKGNGVGVVDAHAPGPDRKLAGERAQRRVGREFSLEFDRERPLRGHRWTLPVERLEVGKAQIIGLDGKGSGVPLRSLSPDCPSSGR